MKKYLSDYPELLKEWHPTKNKDLDPNDFSYGSIQTVWGRCLKNRNHEWQTKITARTKKTPLGIHFVLD